VVLSGQDWPTLRPFSLSWRIADRVISLMF
jgi:hypothetical protein